MSRARASFCEVPQPVREPPPTFDDLIFLCVAITQNLPFTLFKNCQQIEYTQYSDIIIFVMYSENYSQKRNGEYL